MGKLKILGGKKLSGSINISGAKNSALPIIAASIINRGKVTLYNVPNISDVTDMLEILKHLNVSFDFVDSTLIIDSSELKYQELKHDNVKKIRASYYFIGSMIACFNKVNITTPGGCSIGSRPIDFHINVIEQMGASYTFEEDILDMKISKYKSFIYTFEKKSVGATINALLASVNSKKKIVLKNVSREPEVEDVINFLNNMGCNIVIRKNTYICNPTYVLNTICRHTIIPDRIEAATYIALGLLCGETKLYNVNTSHLKHFLRPLIKNNADIRIMKNHIIAKKSYIDSFNITTGEYPKFSTDLQPIIVVLLALSNGYGFVEDSIFSERFKSCVMLNKMKSAIQISGEKITYRGVDKLIGCEVDATDLRAAAALILAGLAAEGITTINNIEYINRGYANIYENIRRLGGTIDVI